jgi:hypothetical protein
MTLLTDAMVYPLLSDVHNICEPTCGSRHAVVGVLFDDGENFNRFYRFCVGLAKNIWDLRLVLLRWINTPSLRAKRGNPCADVVWITAMTEVQKCKKGA